MENALVHSVGDVDELTRQITSVHFDRELLNRLRNSSLRTIDEITWKAAGKKLLAAYGDTIAAHRSVSFSS
jgi:hypothetical protein